MQTDPIGYEDQMNLYAYVHNDPLNYTDPTGKAGIAACAVPGVMQACAAAAVKAGTAVATGAKWTAVAIAGLWAGNELLNDSSNPVDDLIGTTTPGEETKGRTRNHEKPGTIGTANDDFDGIIDPDSVKDRGNGVRTGTTTDGRSANVRPRSTDGRPTVEIQDGKNKDKIRYNDPDKQN